MSVSAPTGGAADQIAEGGSAPAEMARLRWRCRRGMRELDIVLLAYLNGAYRTLAAEDKSKFAAILELPDPEILAYVAGRSQPPDERFARIIDGIRVSIHPQT